MIDFLPPVSILLTEVRVKLFPHFALSGPLVPEFQRFPRPRVDLQALVLVVTTTFQVKTHRVSGARGGHSGIVIEERAATWGMVVLIVLLVVDVVSWESPSQTVRGLTLE